MNIEEASKILSSVFPQWVMDLQLRILSVEPDSIRLFLPPGPHLARVGGFTAGQVTLAVADTAMVIAVSAALGEFRPVATLNLAASFMRPLANNGVVCEASVVRKGRTLAFCTASLMEMDRPQMSVQVSGTYSIPPEAKRDSGIVSE